MIRHILFAATIFCSTGAINTVQSQKMQSTGSNEARQDVRFLEDITVEAEPVQVTASDPKAVFAKSLFKTKSKKEAPKATPAASSIESASGLQFKFALLLDTEVEQVSNLKLFEAIDDWLGTRYRYGGSTKKGVDCSALMQTLFSTVFGITIPRTAREQYQFSTRISRTELREGDLIFFNTTGGISHVGMYLQNNKFVHASSSGGVMISDMYEDYWVRKFVGVGRIESESLTASVSNP